MSDIGSAYKSLTEFLKFNIGMMLFFTVYAIILSSLQVTFAKEQLNGKCEFYGEYLFWVCLSLGIAATGYDLIMDLFRVCYLATGETSFLRIYCCMAVPSKEEEAELALGSTKQLPGSVICPCLCKEILFLIYYNHFIAY